MLSHDLWRNQIEGISKFTGSNAVFPARVQIYVFLLPKFFFKHWWYLMDISKLCKVSVFDRIILSNKQQTIAFFISAPASRPHVDPASRSLPPPVLLGSCPLSPSTFGGGRISNQAILIPWLHSYANFFTVYVYDFPSFKFLNNSYNLRSGVKALSG